MKHGYSQPRNKKADQIDFNDVAFVLQRAKSPIIESIPAPISRYADGPYKGQDKINPNCSVFRHADGLATFLFHLKPIYYLNINGGWRPMSEVASHYGAHEITLKEGWERMMDLRYLASLMENFKVSIPSPYGVSPLVQGGRQLINFTVSTFYPATGSGGDVDIERIVPGASEPTTGGEDWATISAGNGTNVSTITDTALHLRYFPLQSSNKWYILGRLLFQIDTSALGDSDNITAVTGSLYVNSKSDTDGQFGDLGWAASTPASTTTFAASDFQTCGSAAFSSYINYDSSLPTGQYNDFAFNATGIAAVSKTGFTKLSFQMKEDITGSSPTHSYNGGHNNNISFQAADASGSSQDPKLAVTVPDPFKPIVMVIM